MLTVMEIILYIQPIEKKTWTRVHQRPLGKGNFSLIYSKLTYSRRREAFM